MVVDKLADLGWPATTLKRPGSYARHAPWDVSFHAVGARALAMR